MDSLKIVRRMLGGVVLIGIAAGVCGSLELAADGDFTLLGFLLAALLGFWVMAAILSRRARVPAPPKYSESELKQRVRAALQSSNKFFVSEVMGDVAAQWGDGKDWRKLGAKLAVLRGNFPVNVSIPDAGDWDENTLKRLYPNVYGDPEGGKSDEYD